MSPDDYANRTVSAGELILLNGGEYDGVFIAGLFRATQDLNFNDLMDSYLETIKVGAHDFVAPELPPVAFGIDPRSSNPVERGFIAWLGEQKLIERVPTVEVRLTGGFTVAGQAVGNVQVDDAKLHRELSQGFGR